MNLRENKSAFEELVTAVTEAFAELGLDIYNIGKTRSRRDYNCYRASYASIYTPLLSIRNELIVETYVGLLPYPTEKRMVNNYIYQFLHRYQEQDYRFFLVFGCVAAWDGELGCVRLAAAAPDLRLWKRQAICRSCFQR